MSKKFGYGGEVLKGLREKLGLTQQQFADKVGVHSQMVSNWERGICSPPKYKLNKIFHKQPEVVRYNYVICSALDAKNRLEDEYSAMGFWPMVIGRK